VELGFKFGLFLLHALALSDVLNCAGHANRSVFLVTKQDASTVQDSKGPVGTHCAKLEVGRILTGLACSGPLLHSGDIVGVDQ
jgi:hypothetical protein